MSDPKQTILARRAKFVAAAVAGVGLAAACAAEPCLDIAVPDDAGGDGADAGKDGGPADTGPTPCLSPVEDTGTALDAADANDGAVADGSAEGGPG